MTREECIALLYRYAEYNGMGIPNLAGCREAMKMAADLLSQPSLPSDIDEAAEKYAKGEGLENALGGWEDMSDAFKAGAEWMAGQGVNADFGVCKLADRAWLTPIDEKRFTQDVFDNFAAGDKVIVQIRKKQ